MSTSTEYIFRKNSFTDYKKSPPRDYIPKSKSNQSYDIKMNLDFLTVTVNTTPYLPQIGLFLTNNQDTFIIVNVQAQELKAVPFHYHLLLSKKNKSQDYLNKKRQIYNTCQLEDYKITLTFQEITQLYNSTPISFIVYEQGYKMTSDSCHDCHFIVSNQFKMMI